MVGAQVYASRARTGTKAEALAAIRRPLRLGAACAQHPVVGLVPVLRRAADAVACELVDDEERRERGEQVEALPERVHVVQHVPRDDGIPPPK